MFDTQYELSVMEKIQIAESGSYLMTKKHWKQMKKMGSHFIWGDLNYYVHISNK